MVETGKIHNGAFKKWRKNRTDEKIGYKYMVEIGKIENLALKKWRKNRNDEKTGDEKTGFYCI